MTRSLTRPTLLAAPVAFAAMLAVLVLLMGTGRGDSVAGPAADAAALRGAPDAPSPRATTDQRIRILQATVRADPRRADGYVLLADAYAQKVRETGDAAYYVRADAVLRRALHLAPADPGALTGRASLEASRHDFRASLRDARAARRAAPDVAKPYGVLVDSLVELGRYGAAGRALQEMVDRRPDLAAYARVSYFRELHGDLRGAVAAMELAVSAGGGTPENTAYVQALLGDLEFARGDVGAAAVAYRQALFVLPRPRAVRRRAREGRGRARRRHRRDPSPARGGRPPPAAAVRRRARRDRARRRAPGRRASRPRARRRRGAAARAWRCQHRRRSRALRGRSRQLGTRRDARSARVGERAERALGRRARLGAHPRRRARRRGSVGAPRAAPRIARPDVPLPRRDGRPGRGRPLPRPPVADARARREPAASRRSTHRARRGR